MTQSARSALSWFVDAACAGLPSADVPRSVCEGCAPRWACLDHALQARVTTGTWGGYTHDERTALLERHAGDAGESLAAAYHQHEATNARAAGARGTHPADQPALFDDWDGDQLSLF